MPIQNKWWWRCLSLAAFCVAGASGGVEVSSATNRPVLGAERTPVLRFDSSVVATSPAPERLLRRLAPRAPVTNVQVAGSWDVWTGRYDLVQSGEDLWELDTRTLGARLGRHEFKFIVNGTWEDGANRFLPINLEGEIEPPPAAGKKGRHYIAGMGKIGQQVKILLDIEALLEDEELDQLDASAQ